jgi:signal peptide peptidase SppA
MKKAIDAVLAAPWAITPEYLQVIASIAEREHEFAGNIEALEARLGRPLGNTLQTTVRDGVAIIPMEGPLLKRAGLFSQISGATDYANLARDITTALEDPSIQAVLLLIDSPGGEVRGVTELAAIIGAAQKPVWAFVEGTMASAAFWLGSAADKIIASETAIIGSVGVMQGYKVAAEKAGEKTYCFVSSQSPLKSASPETEAGAAEIQSIVDGVAEVFIQALAQNRNTTAENVVESFGKGSVFVAAEAVKRGMIDGIGTFESTLNALKQENETMDWKTLTVAALTENRADLVAEITAAAVASVASVEKVDVAAVQAQAAADERARIVDLEALAMPGTEELVAKFKADGTKPEAAAIQLLQAARAAAAQPAATAAAAHLAGLKQTEQTLMPPKAGTGQDAEPTEAEAATAAIALARKAGIDA